ncbi:MAG TPA: hypothetical protein VGB79_06385 [Allosphingosinicella sp.]
MKYVIAAFAIAIATPAAAQQPAAPQSHGQHVQHQGHGQGEHQGHGQPGQAQHQGHGQHQGARESCPCCAPGPNGQRPACCEGMRHQGGQQGAQPQGDHGNH